MFQMNERKTLYLETPYICTTSQTAYNFSQIEIGTRKGFCELASNGKLNGVSISDITSTSGKIITV